MKASFFEKVFKDRKVLIFEIKLKKRHYLRNKNTFWAHFLSVTGKEVTGAIDTAVIRRNAIYTIGYNADIKEGMYVEDNSRIYIIKHVDRKEGYKTDLKLSCLETKEADKVEEA